MVNNLIAWCLFDIGFGYIGGSNEGALNFVEGMGLGSGGDFGWG